MGTIGSVVGNDEATQGKFDCSSAKSGSLQALRTLAREARHHRTQILGSELKNSPTFSRQAEPPRHRDK
eukprot:12820635-Prorocentrum_lima.AAC.1